MMGDRHDFWAWTEWALPIKKIGGMGRSGYCPLRKMVAMVPKWVFTK